jgi:hypothetical protein
MQHHLSLELTGCDLEASADPGALLDLAAALLEAIDDEARDGALPMHIAVRDALWGEWSVIQIAECSSITARVDEASGDARLEIAGLRPRAAGAAGDRPPGGPGRLRPLAMRAPDPAPPAPTTTRGG